MNDLMQENKTVPETGKELNNRDNVSPDLDREMEDLNRQSQRMQQLIEQIDGLPHGSVKELVQACINEILTFYGKGLEKIVTVLMNESSTAATKILNELMEDSFISGLLLIHDLHPLDLQTRLHLALEKVRPYIQSHGGNVELVSLDDGVARIKLSGSCKSCASSSVTLELAIKQSLEENCPDLLGLEVEGVAGPHKTGEPVTAAQPVTPGWKILSGVESLTNGAMKFLECNGIPLFVCKVNDLFYAYRNNCPACDMPLSTGTIEGSVISCRLGHRFDVQQAGRCTDEATLHLDPFPLLNENGKIKVAVG